MKSFAVYSGRMKAYALVGTMGGSKYSAMRHEEVYICTCETSRKIIKSKK